MVARTLAQQIRAKSKKQRQKANRKAKNETDTSNSNTAELHDKFKKRLDMARDTRTGQLGATNAAKNIGTSHTVPALAKIFQESGEKIIQKLMASGIDMNMDKKKFMETLLHHPQLLGELTDLLEPKTSDDISPPPN